jgi:hypothetical protein
MSDFREIQKLEDKLMEEIKHEKFFSFKRFVKLLELQSLYRMS